MTHVLVVRLDNDGDVLLAGPAIRALAARRRPRHAAVRPARAPGGASCCPASTRSICWRAPWIDPEPAPVDSADVLVQAARLAALDIDRALIFGSFHQSPLPTALLLRLAHVPWIGAISVDYPGSLLDLRHHVSDDIHEVERDAVARHRGRLRAARGRPRCDRRRRSTPSTIDGRTTWSCIPGRSVPARAWEPERNARAGAGAATGTRSSSPAGRASAS